MKNDLLNGASPAVSAAASAGPVDKVAARAKAAAAVQARTGLDPLSAGGAVDVAMRSLQESGLVTVAATELARIGETVARMQYALAQAYVALEVAADDASAFPTTSGEIAAVLALIEQTLGGKPQRVTTPDA